MINKKIGKKKSTKKEKPLEWTEENDKKLFELYKEKGSSWASIASEFPGLNRHQVKNRFYSTLRRLETKRANIIHKANPVKTKPKDLIGFVDEAIAYGHNCKSKKGRKRKCKLLEPEVSKKPIYDSLDNIPININSDCISDDNILNDISSFNYNQKILDDHMKFPINEEYRDYSDIIDCPEYDRDSILDLGMMILQNDSTLNEFGGCLKMNDFNNGFGSLLEIEMEDNLFQSQNIFTNY